MSLIFRYSSCSPPALRVKKTLAVWMCFPLAANWNRLGEALSSRFVIVKLWKLVLPAPPPLPCAAVPALLTPNEKLEISISPLWSFAVDSPLMPSSLRNVLPLPPPSPN